MSIIVPQLDPCPFCEYLAGETPCAFVTHGKLASSFVNLRQYERGALLVVPNAHLTTLLELDNELLAAVYGEARRVGEALIQAFGAVGLNVFQNNGVNAGQTIPHSHVHVVPRYAHSDPTKLFSERRYEVTPYEARLEIAQSLRGALAQSS